MEFSISTSLHGKRGLVVGIANEASIAAGCARAFVAAGATLAATYLNDKAQSPVRVITDTLGCKLLLACDVRVPGQLEATFERIRAIPAACDRLRAQARSARPRGGLQRRRICFGHGPPQRRHSPALLRTE